MTIPQEALCPDPAYDKISNSVFMTFYVEGGGIAPWVESIKTIPAKVKEEDDFQITVRVNDADKDELRLTTEVYFKKELIYREKGDGFGKRHLSHNHNGKTARSGRDRKL